MRVNYAYLVFWDGTDPCFAIDFYGPKPKKKKPVHCFYNRDEQYSLVLTKFFSQKGEYFDSLKLIT